MRNEIARTRSTKFAERFDPPHRKLQPHVRELDPLAALAESRLADLRDHATPLERGKADTTPAMARGVALLEAAGGLQALLELENEKRLELLRARLAEYTSRRRSSAPRLLQPALRTCLPTRLRTSQTNCGHAARQLSLQRQASQELKIVGHRSVRGGADGVGADVELACSPTRRATIDAIDHYTEAAEWYLKALKLEPDEKEKGGGGDRRAQRAEEPKRGRKPRRPPPPPAAAPALPAAAPTPARRPSCRRGSCSASRSRRSRAVEDSRLLVCAGSTISTASGLRSGAGATPTARWR